MKSHDEFPGQKILVTGASGFIGSHLCRRLCMSGVEVHAISRITHSVNESYPRWWQGDLAEISTARDLLKAIKPDVIFHLAAHGWGGRDLTLVLPTFRSNLMTTVNLLTVASETGCRRIVLPGSLEEPDQGDPQPVPSSPYAVAKWSSTVYARMFHALYQLPVVTPRVFMAYGPQQNLRKLIPYVIHSLLQGKTPQLTSGRRQVDWIYIDDVIHGLLAAAQVPRVEGHTIDLGSGILVSIHAVVKRLVKLVGSSVEPLFGALPDPALEPVRVANIADSYEKLGWKPLTSLERGLEQTVNWYRTELNL